MLGRLCLVELLSFIIAILFHTIPGKLVINKTHNELLAIVKDKRSEIVLGPPADRSLFYAVGFMSIIMYIIN